MCGAPGQDAVLDQTLPAGVDPKTATILQGRVVRGDEPVPSAYVRLLDASGDFTAEVVSSATGAFRFFASPGRWTIRALSAAGTGEQTVDARTGFTETQVELA
jgi:hypothetical protein